MMKNLMLIFLLLACGPAALAQDQEATERKTVDLRLEARADYDRGYIDGEKNDAGTGLRGNIVDVFLQGDISDHFSYKYRQRLNGINKDKSFFDATDWLYVAYKPSDRVTLMAGKWVALLGGWELDPAPIDVFHLSEFCYHYACYQWGVTAGWKTADKRSEFMAQVCESPFRKMYEARAGKAADLWSYNLMWYGNYGLFHSSWSVNMIEYTPGSYINFISLGNRFDLGQNIVWDIDVVNRAAKGQAVFFKDFSIMSRFNYIFSKSVDAWARVSYDVNKTDYDRDFTLGKGTEMTRVGAGINYYPLKNDKLRLHANYSYSFGDNTTPDAFLHDKESRINVGVSWKMNILSR